MCHALAFAVFRSFSFVSLYLVSKNVYLIPDPTHSDIYNADNSTDISGTRRNLGGYISDVRPNFSRSDDYEQERCVTQLVRGSVHVSL